MTYSYFGQIYDEINELGNILSIGSTGVIICTYRNVNELQTIKEMLRKVICSRVRFESLEYSNDEDLVSQINEILSKPTFKIKERIGNKIKEQSTILEINGLEKVFDTGSTGKLNYLRDFFIEINFVTLIWLQEKYISKLATEAPDFWRLRMKVFRFRAQKASKRPIILMSYSNSDRDIAMKLYSYLKGYDAVIPTHNDIGDLADDPTIKGFFYNISTSRILILIISTRYIKKFFQTDMNTKLARIRSDSNSRIILIVYEKLTIPSELSFYRFIDLSENFQNGLRALVNELGLSLKLENDLSHLLKR